VVPGGIPAERRAALLAVASHCTVHNTLRQQPGIAIDLA
jgi:putative redox protein